MFCPNCGSQVVEGKAFCGSCGARLCAAGEGPAIQSPPPLPPVPRRSISLRQKLTYALVVLLAALGGVAWWWFHRPAPPFQAQDPGIYWFSGLSPDGKTPRFGFIDADGNILIQPQWDEVNENFVQGQRVFFSEGLCSVKKDGKWGFIDKNGNLVVPAQFDQARPFVGGIAAVLLGNQWGFIDKTGRYIINPQFENVGDFHDGLAAAQKDGKWGFINRSGSFAIPARFNNADRDGFADGVAWVSTEGKIGFINRSGTFAIPPQFDGAYHFTDGRAAILLGGKWGYIDLGGRIVVNPQFEWATGFYHGRALVSVSGNFGTIDQNGQFILNPGRYTLASDPCCQMAPWEGLLDVSTNDGRGMMTMDGQWVVQPSKAITGFAYPLGKVVYVALAGNMFAVISRSGKVLTGPYKGEMLDTLVQDIDNEKSAIQSMHALISAETNYAVLYPDAPADASVQKLGPGGGAPDERHANLIDVTLATGTKDGYQFKESNPDHRAETGMNYKIVATPLPGHGGRTFCTQPEVGYDSQTNKTFPYQVATKPDGTIIRDTSGAPLPLLDAQGKPVPWVVSYPIRYAVPGDQCTATSPIL